LKVYLKKSFPIKGVSYELFEALFEKSERNGDKIMTFKCLA
jgi:hypothetical protein